MISFMEFVNRVENAKPPILKKYKKKVRLTCFQGIGLCLLVSFSLFIPFILWTSYKEYGKLMDDTVFVAIFFLIALGITWVFFIYSLKHFTFKEKRKIYNPSSSTKWWDRLVIIFAICGFLFGCTGNLPDFASIVIALFSILGAVGYFFSPWRERKVNNKIPLYQLLSVLGWEQKLHDRSHPFFFSKHGEEGDYQVKIPLYFQFKINGNFAYIGQIRFWDVYRKNPALRLETITFNFPKYSQDTNIILKNIKQFIASPTGQDLFFHQPISEHFIEEKNGRLEISFSTTGDIGEFVPPMDEDEDFNDKCEDSDILPFHPNFYQDKYFYYTREDLDTIYQDVQTLMNALDSRYG